MTCNCCGRRTSRRLCRDCDRERRQEDRVDADYGRATESDDQEDSDEIATDGGFENLGDALALVQEASAPLFTPTTDALDAHLSLARAGLVNAEWVDGHREQRLEEVDHHLAAAVAVTDNQDIVVPARNARQLIRAFSGGETA